MHICENLRFVWQSYFAAKFSFLMRSKISIIFFTHMPKQWKSCVYFTLHLLHNLKLVQPAHHFSLYILLPHVRIFSDCCMVLPLCPCVCLFSFYKHKKKCKISIALTISYFTSICFNFLYFNLQSVLNHLCPYRNKLSDHQLLLQM